MVLTHSHSHTHPYSLDDSLTMRVVVDTNLRTLIDDASIPLQDAHKAKIAVHIAKGMEYLHRHNVIHRDLKVHSSEASNKTDIC